MAKNTRTRFPRIEGVTEIAVDAARLIVAGALALVGPLVDSMPSYCKWYVPEMDSDKAAASPGSTCA